MIDGIAIIPMINQNVIIKDVRSNQDNTFGVEQMI